MASITIDGVERIAQKLGSLATFDILRDPMQRAVFRLQRDMATYPPAPPNSSYRRTGTLGRRWTTRVQRTSDGLLGTVGNVTYYAPMVQSKRYQRPIFRRIGWPTDEEVAERNVRDIVRDFAKTIEKALD